jgi:HEAT repeat protein
MAALLLSGPSAGGAQQNPLPVTLGSAIDMLRSPDPVQRVRGACARRVYDAGAAEAIPPLVALLDDDEPVAPEVCREDGRRWWGEERPITPGQEAARALVRIGMASFDPLVTALQGSGATARRNAAWALGALDDARGVAPLVGALRDGSDGVREQSAWALGAIEDSRAVQPLIGALGDAAPAVRRQAAWALGAIDDGAAVDALIASLEDSDAKVREQAAWALGVIDDARAIGGLTLALGDSESRVRRQAAWALGAISD